jgi:hypothetical protein
MNSLLVQDKSNQPNLKKHIFIINLLMIHYSHSQNTSRAAQMGQSIKNLKSDETNISIVNQEYGSKALIFPHRMTNVTTLDLANEGARHWRAGSRPITEETQRVRRPLKKET